MSGRIAERLSDYNHRTGSFLKKAFFVWYLSWPFPLAENGERWKGYALRGVAAGVLWQNIPISGIFDGDTWWQSLLITVAAILLWPIPVTYWLVVAFLPWVLNGLTSIILYIAGWFVLAAQWFSRETGFNLIPEMFENFNLLDNAEDAIPSVPDVREGEVVIPD